MISPASPHGADAAPPVAGTPQAADGMQADDMQADDTRVAFLFRHSRQASRVHVLQHLVQRWRDERAADAAVPRPFTAQPAAPAAEATAAAAVASTLVDLGSLQQRIAQLPALPRAAAEALAMLRDEDSGAEDCARCIGT